VREVRFDTCIEKLHQLWAIVSSRLYFEDFVMGVAHVFEKLGNFSALTYQPEFKHSLSLSSLG